MIQLRRVALQPELIDKGSSALQCDCAAQPSAASLKREAIELRCLFWLFRNPAAVIAHREDFIPQETNYHFENKDICFFISSYLLQGKLDDPAVLTTKLDLDGYIRLPKWNDGMKVLIFKAFMT